MSNDLIIPHDEHIISLHNIKAAVDCLVFTELKPVLTDMLWHLERGSDDGLARVRGP